MKKINKIRILIVFLSICILAAAIFAFWWKVFGKKHNTKVAEVIKNENISKKGEWKLIWNDEFNGNKLDLTKWDYEIGNGYNGWGNNELQYYTKNNVSVANGKLIIEAKNEKVGTKDYSSGRICTKTMNGDALFSTTYGKIEARIKLPAGTGLWPAFWMLPVEDAYGQWPLSGEIDIMEARGRLLDKIQGAIHYGELSPNDKQSYGLYSFPNGENITGYHTYSIEWNVNKIIWYVDGKEYFSESNWYTSSEDKTKSYNYPAPFNRSFYLLLNLAVGGKFDEDKIPNNANLPGKMEVDYIRVYERTGVNAKNIGETDSHQHDTNKENDVSSEKVDNPLDTEHFDVGYDKWAVYSTQAFVENIDNNSVCKIEAKPSHNWWDSMFIYNNLNMKGNITYELSFRAKASLEDQLFMVTLEDSKYNVEFQKSFLVGEQWKDYKYRVKIKGDSLLSLKYMLGAVAKECSLYLDDVSIKVLG
ncbi:MAG: glycoside hydrolase family 16 protein [Bacillota bacterium]|nr:glycoside hydrolase family 16 protein [Bacillota bacterium]